MVMMYFQPISTTARGGQSQLSPANQQKISQCTIVCANTGALYIAKLLYSHNPMLRGLIEHKVKQIFSCFSASQTLLFVTFYDLWNVTIPTYPNVNRFLFSAINHKINVIIIYILHNVRCTKIEKFQGSLPTVLGQQPQVHQWADAKTLLPITQVRHLLARVRARRRIVVRNLHLAEGKEVI